MYKLFSCLSKLQLSVQDTKHRFSVEYAFIVSVCLIIFVFTLNLQHNESTFSVDSFSRPAGQSTTFIPRHFTLSALQQCVLLSSCRLKRVQISGCGTGQKEEGGVMTTGLPDGSQWAHVHKTTHAVLYERLNDSVR